MCNDTEHNTVHVGAWYHVSLEHDMNARGGRDGIAVSRDAPEMQPPISQTLKGKGRGKEHKGRRAAGNGVVDSGARVQNELQPHKCTKIHDTHSPPRIIGGLCGILAMGELFRKFPPVSCHMPSSLSAETHQCSSNRRSRSLPRWSYTVEQIRENALLRVLTHRLELVSSYPPVTLKSDALYSSFSASAL